MEKLIFAVNIGSSSKKYGLFRDGVELGRALVEQTNKGVLGVTFIYGGQTDTQTWREDTYQEAAGYVLIAFIKQGVVLELSSIKTIGIRIVAPGRQFAAHTFINDTYLSSLTSTATDAPLHIQPILNEITLLHSYLPNAQFIAASDSAFHSTLPERARTYALPRKICSKYGLERIGYHGLSVASAMRTIPRLIGQEPKRVVICHLGSGVSVTAVQDGNSTDTSMGFTPLEGVPMGTRIGNVDPGVLTLIAKREHIDAAELQTLLTKESGLRAISGTTGDVKNLLAARQNGDQKAALALSVFVYQIQKYIGAYAAALGGIDTLIFTGTIGERSAYIRKEICLPLQYLGIQIDEQKNQNIDSNQGSLIQAENARVSIAVIPTDELAEIARITTVLNSRQ